MTHQILRLPEVINRTGVPRSTLYAKVAEGEFPTPIKLGQRSIGWSAADIDSWIEERIAEREEKRAAGRQVGKKKWFFLQKAQ